MRVAMKFEIRKLIPGMGEAVAKRTILRTKKDGSLETWEDVAKRVAAGNVALLSKKYKSEAKREYDILYKHIANGSMLMSGRHLQHGDETQPERNMEVFTNCSTSSSSFILFYLLLNGCFRAGTVVKMADGRFKKIEEIEPGDIVVSYDESKKEFVHQEVIKLNTNQPKPMVKVRLADGKEVICTTDHKFLTTDGVWIEAKDLAGKEVVQYAKRESGETKE